MRTIKSEDSEPELVVRRIAHRMGFRYRLHVASLPGKPDIVFSRLRRIVEVYGCFWHQHAKCVDGRVPKSRQDYWIPKLARNCERDKSNLKTLRAMGWRVMVVWECETANYRKLEQRLARFLNPPA